MIPRAVQAVPTDDFHVYVCLADGSVHLYDARPLIERGGVFKPLEDIEVFKKTATILNHTLAWDLAGTRDEYQCLDIDPVTIAHSPRAKDPLT